MSIIPYISTILAVQVHPASRTVSSPATCNDEYSWMNDANNDSACLTVAYVEAAYYVQPVLNPGYSYSLPNATSGNQCYCSWSSYNLMMACTLCQGANSTWQQVIHLVWPEWASGCTNQSWTEEYFPSGYVLSGNASIPAWAANDPTKWSYSTFNIIDASNIYQTNSSYITPGASPSSSSSSSSSSPKSTDVGAIVGGTVGGAAVLLLLAVGAYLLYRRHIYRKVYVSAIHQQGTPFMSPGTHNRIPSDMSHFAPSMSGPLALYGQSTSPSQQLGTAFYSQPQATYPSLQGSASPPPRTDASVYTTQTTNGRRPDAIPMV
ncbi:hypothetical protein BDR04DRAFT_1159893 [Suillus decipiens]|nr:hypothetical protein BDR04DRAFT_1159893 [Suillus decipiens]